MFFYYIFIFGVCNDRFFMGLKIEYKEYIILFKSGSFYVCFNEDAIVMNKIFNYKLVELKENVKIGFPISLIDKNLNILEKKKINYIIVEQKNIIARRKYKFNNYCKYSENLDFVLNVCSRIQSITKKLQYIKDYKKIENILNQTEEILYE